MKTRWEKFEFIVLVIFATAWTAALGDLVYVSRHLPPERCAIDDFRR